MKKTTMNATAQKAKVVIRQKCLENMVIGHWTCSDIHYKANCPTITLVFWAVAFIVVFFMKEQSYLSPFFCEAGIIVLYLILVK